MGVAAGISLLSCLRAEIYVISYPLPVSGRCLCFTTYPDIEQHHYFLLRVLWHWKRVITFEIVLLSGILVDIRVITKCQPPSWISDFRFHLGLSPTAPFKSLTVAVGILFLDSLEAEIPLGVVYPPFNRHKNNLQHMRVKRLYLCFRGGAVHSDYWDVVRRNRY